MRILLTYSFYCTLFARVKIVCFRESIKKKKILYTLKFHRHNTILLLCYDDVYLLLYCKYAQHNITCSNILNARFGYYFLAYLF